MKPNEWNVLSTEDCDFNFTSALIVPGGMLIQSLHRTFDAAEENIIGESVALSFVPCERSTAISWINEHRSES